MSDNVILVDEHDRQIGIMPKLEAHKAGKLHRAFSIFIFNTDGQLLLQQRADSKYHSPGLWSNTCCSHPRPDETVLAAANRRLMEEMSLDTPLQHIFSFIYRAQLDNGLIEYEYDHVFTGISDALPALNAEEVKSYQYIDIETLLNGILKNPENYTSWLKHCINLVIQNKADRSPIHSFVN